MSFYKVLQPMLFAIDSEKSHNITLKALSLMHRFHLLFYPTIENPVKTMGLTFRNPIGLAAGMDKNGDYMDPLGALGFGFIEVGTVTPRPQEGNPHPRLFRLSQQKALINRMGFNNKGVDHLVTQLKRRRYQGLVGVNMGKNKETPLDEAKQDYLTVMEKVYPYTDYCVVNISSPNTPQLRALQGIHYLKDLLSTLKQAQSRFTSRYQYYRPLLVKLAPDIPYVDLKDVAQCLRDEGMDGVIMSNTTVERPGLEEINLAKEAGGLSGAPLTNLATDKIKMLANYLQGRLPIIASGGIMSASDAEAKQKAGAVLVQLYTGLVYEGPDLIKQCAYIDFCNNRH